MKSRTSVPIIHCETLNKNELGIAMQIISAFETYGYSFACVFQNLGNPKQLNLHSFGAVSNRELKQIASEIADIYRESDFDELTVN